MGATSISPKFYWLQFVHALITELNASRKEIYKMNYIESLNWLSYFKQRNEVAANNAKENKH